MNTYNTSGMMSLILIVSVTCFCLTRSSHALSLHQKLIDLGTSVAQINVTLSDITANLGRITATLDELLTANINVDELIVRINKGYQHHTESTSCPARFIGFEASCYYFSNQTISHAGWDYARAQCEIKGAKLVSIETKQEADFLRNHALSANTYWTSAHRHASYWVWEATGMNVTDGYQPWFLGEPNMATYYCTYFYGSTGKLYDLQCNHSGIRYICETKISSFL